MRGKRKIAVVTGTRAEYGLLKPVMKAIAMHPDLDLQLLVTGTHFDARYGHSVDFIEADGFHIDARVPLSAASDSGRATALLISEGIGGMTEAFAALEPEVVLVLGDRSEILAATIAAAYQNLPLAHIHGGDRSRGGLDESVRHAITKFAHIHFPATETSAQRIRQLGERPEHVFVTGAPALDTILHIPLPDPDQLSHAIGLELEEDYVLLVQHSVSTQPSDAARQFGESLAALRQWGRQVLCIYPNSDAGGLQIIRLIEEEEKRGHFFAFKSLPHPVFLGLMKHCGLMLGNSSSGIIESSSFQIPVVNLGIRQEGRERADNVIDAPHDAGSILKAMEKAGSDTFRKKLAGVSNPYGLGDTGLRIANILANFDLDHSLLQKQITY